MTAEGQANRDPGDELRTYWFTTVGALAHVQEFGGSSIVRRILHGTTALEDLSAEESLGTLRDPATFLSDEELETRVRRWADTAGVVVEELNYVPFLGGTAELVLRPKDELEFMKGVDLTMYRLFSGFPQEEERPFLVTFVDSSGANRRVAGGFSLGDDRRIRLSDGTRAIVGGSEGFGWQADDLSERLGVDVSGRSIEPARPVENIPEPSIADLSSMYEELCRGLGIERAAKSFKSAPTAAAAAKAVAEVEPEGPRRDAIYKGCLRGLSG